MERCLTLQFKSGSGEMSWLEMWGEKNFLRCRRECAEGKTRPVPRAFSALGLSSLSEQRGRFFPCNGEQLDNDEDYDEWVYAPLRRRGIVRIVIADNVTLCCCCN